MFIVALKKFGYWDRLITTYKESGIEAVEEAIETILSSNENLEKRFISQSHEMMVDYTLYLLSKEKDIEEIKVDFKKHVDEIINEIFN